MDAILFERNYVYLIIKCKKNGLIDSKFDIHIFLQSISSYFDRFT